METGRVKWNKSLVACDWFAGDVCRPVALRDGAERGACVARMRTPVPHEQRRVSSRAAATAHHLAPQRSVDHHAGPHRRRRPRGLWRPWPAVPAHQRVRRTAHRVGDRMSAVAGLGNHGRDAVLQ